MRTLLIPLTVALTVVAIPARAQVYPERVRAVTRVRVEAPKVERYQRRDNREEQTERSTKTVRLGANGRLDISNIAGDIKITRGSGGDAVIEIVKTAHGRTVDDARELLQLVDVDIAERTGRAEIRTRYPSGDEMRTRNRRNVNVSVAFTIAAPAGTSITAQSISGNIMVRDIQGELSLNSVSGNIVLDNADRVASAKSVSGNVEITGTELATATEISSVSGDVIMRKVKARRLDLGTVSGNVLLDDVTCERAGMQSMSGNVEFRGALARNGRYELRSHSGEIKVMLSGDTGFEVEASSFSGSVRSDLPITSQNRNRDRERERHSLRGVYGDGSAVLDLTTFSGSIVIMKR